MTQLIADTSVWIDFFNRSNSTSETELLFHAIRNNFNVCICPVIYQEILQGIKEDKIYRDIKQILNNFTILNIKIINVTEHAIDLYRFLRKKGVTIRKSNDCLIASYAILCDIPVLHKDCDFDKIEKFTKLKIFRK
ncbi:MAG: PIN domain-containing protein [Spirochaetes bacterium]|nr:PIN domain-containing protein [Spirochaetota bacterium]